MFRFFILLLLLTLAPTTQAHHTTASQGNGKTGTWMRLNTLSTLQNRLYSAYDFTQLDASIGQTHSLLFGGEWAFSQKLSVSGLLPVSFINRNSGGSDEGLGDVSLEANWKAWDSSATFGYLTLGFSLPTGDEDKGLGRGEMGQQVNLWAGFPISKWNLSTSLGSQVGLSLTPEPVVLHTLGITTPATLNEKITFGLNLSTQIFAQSEVFKNGSYKTYLEPSMMITPKSDGPFSVILGAKVSVIDGLERKNGLALASTNHSLLNDGLWGASLGLQYNFKREKKCHCDEKHHH